MTIDVTALKKLMDLVGGEPEDLEEFIEDFTEIAPDLVADMRHGLDAQDWDKVRISAHTLKSNAKDLGAPALSKLCETLEHDCRDQAYANAPELVAEIGTAQMAALAALAQINPAEI